MTNFDMQFATRLHCFAVVSAIESDLREVIQGALGDVPAKDVMPPDVLSTAKLRREIDKPGDWYEGEDGLSDLIDYVDFMDSGKILSLNKNELSRVQAEAVSKIVPFLERSSPIRNRVCHTRPLEEDDFRLLVDGANGLLLTSLCQWPQLGRCLTALRENPSWAMSLEIPRFWAIASRSTIQNNLPIPDFDETGFIGREADRKAIMANLMGSHPMVCIVAEGGFGKTALALQVLHDLLEKSERESFHRFDAIVWVSLKAKMLTASGVLEIYSSIQGSSGLFGAIASELGTPNAESKSPAELLAEIRAYLSSLKVLLAIDNCESVPVSDVTQFLQDIPEGSKVFLTSRTGLNIGELPYPLGALPISSSRKLFRKYSQLLNVAVLGQRSDPEVNRYCYDLYCNPLAIKWFIGSVAAGVSVEDLLSKSGEKRQEFLGFLFETVFDKFSATEKLVVQVIQIARRAVSPTEIMWQLGNLGNAVERSDLDTSLRKLVVGGVLRHEAPAFADFKEGKYSRYFLGEAAQDFLLTCSQTDQDLFKSIKEGLSKARATAQRAKANISRYRYSQDTIHAHGHDQELVGTELARALSVAASGNIAVAKELVDRAEQYLPEFSEVYRTGAYLASRAGDLNTADQLYQRALSVDPRSLIARYSYSLFLMSPDVNDLESAVDLLSSILVDDPDAVPVMSALGRCLTKLGRYSEAVGYLEKAVRHSDDFNVQQLEANSCHLAKAYRCWADSPFVRGDPKKFRELIEKSLTPLEECAQDGHWSGGLQWELNKVGESLLEGALRFDAPDLIERLAASVRGSCRCTDAPLHFFGKLHSVQQKFGGQESTRELNDAYKVSGGW